MKILAILEAGNAYPSGFVRALIYKQLWKKHGDQVKFVCLLSPQIIRLDQQVKRWPVKRVVWWVQTLLYYCHEFYKKQIRQFILKEAGKFDRIYLCKVQDYFFVKEIKDRFPNIRIILDFGDAVWLFKGNVKFNELLTLVDEVTTDNKYTAKYVKQFNRNCTIIPDYPQTDLFEQKRNVILKDKNKVVIGWIGSKSTFFNFDLILKPLDRLFNKYPNVQLRLVGVGGIRPKLQNVKYTCLDSYNQKQMVEEVLKMDIGLFPLDQSVNSQVRGILKALIYLNGGVAVVASPVGQNLDFFRHGKNGFLAKNDEEWYKYLEILVLDKKLRKQIARAGQKEVKRNFSLEKIFHLLSSVIEDKQ